METKSDLNHVTTKNNFPSVAVMAGTMLIMPSVIAFASKLDNSKRPNFLIIMADDVSWTSFGCMNPGAFTRTPNINSIARSGIRFSNFYCSSAVSVPVRHELYTGMLPPSSGVYENENPPTGTFFNVNNYLSELGYVVGRAGKNHLKTKYPIKEIPGFTGNCNADSTEWNLVGVKKFIGDAVAEDKNFCTFICSVEGHHPWTMGNPNNFPVASVTVPPFMVDTRKTREALSKHEAEVELFDEQVGASLRLLKEMNLEDNTIVIVLSEQGMAMPLGKFSLYNFGTRALCLFRWPNKISAGTSSQAVSMYCDILPTLIDFAGGKQPNGIDGRSLKQVLMGKSNVHREYAFLVDGQYQRSIASDTYKLIWTPSGKDYTGPTVNKRNSKFFTHAWAEWLEAAEKDPDAKQKVDHVLKHPLYELYDIQKDPYEMVNLADDPKHANTLKKMTEDLKLEIATLKDSIKLTGGKKSDDE